MWPVSVRCWRWRPTARRDCYRDGEELIRCVNEDSPACPVVLITIYRRLLEKIALKQYDVSQ